MSHTYEYPRPSVTLDTVILRTPELGYPEVLLIKRKNMPFAQQWAFPGGFLELDEKPLIGAARELKEETGLYDLPIKPIFACGEPDRDPRGRTITMVYGCLLRDTAAPPRGGDDAAEAAWFSLNATPRMAFDHSTVLAQIEQSLLWQARHLIVGRDVFHDLASAKDILRLHQNLLGQEAPKSIKTFEQRGLIDNRDGICRYIIKLPAGPDWQPLVW